MDRGDLTNLVHCDQDPLLCQSVISTQRLNTIESSLLDHYIQRFCRTYPTCSDVSNPFLSILLPIAMNNDTVLNSILALSGVQLLTEANPSFLRATLQVRHRALKGMQSQLVSLSSALDKDAVIFTLSSCVCLLLFEKLAGNGMANWMPHLRFLSRTFDTIEDSAITDTFGSLVKNREQWNAYMFTRNLFLYNDLIQSTATGGSTLSDYYIRSLQSGDPDESSSIKVFVAEFYHEKMSSIGLSRFYYPTLVAQISSSKKNINDAHIDAWDGRMDWLPSFSLSLSTSVSISHGEYSPQTVGEGVSLETQLMSSIYRYTAKVYMRQMARRREGINIHRAVEIAFFASQTAYLISQLPCGSNFENTLLWPIGIIGPELLADMPKERSIVSQKLHSLCRRFGTKHFERMQEVLNYIWRTNGPLESGPQIEDVFLFG